MSSLNAAIHQRGVTLRSLARNNPVNPLAPASQWKRQHLLAWRVIFQTGSNPILPILQNYTTNLKDKEWPPFIHNFIDGPPRTAAAVSEIPEHDYVRLCDPPSLGSLWAALGEFGGQKAVDQVAQPIQTSDDDMGTAQDSGDDTEMFQNSGDDMDMESDSNSNASFTAPVPRSSSRVRVQTKRDPKFVNSGDFQIESSSPAGSGPPSSGAGRIYLDKESHKANTLSENATLKNLLQPP